jgi:16S rRNA (guanine1516-N2)-methyltransferase
VAPSRDEDLWQLVRSADRMILCSPRDLGPLELSLDLRRGPLAWRLRTARRSDALPRAIGLKRREPPVIVDATAGLARDAMVLAHLGCQVTALERVSALAFLAHDAVETSALAERLTIIGTDARAWLADAPPAEVIYLDPMFDVAGRAQVKKEMQICRALAGPPEGAEQLLALARRVARARVVVKRHAQSPPLAPGANFSVGTGGVRFDVYLPQ